MKYCECGRSVKSKGEMHRTVEFSFTAGYSQWERRRHLVQDIRWPQSELQTCCLYFNFQMYPGCFFAVTQIHLAASSEYRDEFSK